MLNLGVAVVAQDLPLVARAAAQPRATTANAPRDATAVLPRRPTTTSARMTTTASPRSPRNKSVAADIPAQAMSWRFLNADEVREFATRRSPLPAVVFHARTCSGKRTPREFRDLGGHVATANLQHVAGIR